MKRIDKKRDLDNCLRQRKRVLALFCASWCPFCQTFFHVFDKRVVNNDFDEVVCVYIDDNANPLWEEYFVESVPTVILFRQGRVFRRLDGELGRGLSEKQLENWLGKLEGMK
jgi:thioredoxin-like negative regulator of GroEL